MRNKVLAMHFCSSVCALHCFALLALFAAKPVHVRSSTPSSHHPSKAQPTHPPNTPPKPTPTTYSTLKVACAFFRPTVSSTPTPLNSAIATRAVGVWMFSIRSTAAMTSSADRTSPATPPTPSTPHHPSCDHTCHAFTRPHRYTDATSAPTIRTRRSRSDLTYLSPRQCRAHRGDPNTWRANGNSFLLPGVVEFIKRLPFFEQTGKVAIIINDANDTGVEHSDISLDDLGESHIATAARRRFPLVFVGWVRLLRFAWYFRSISPRPLLSVSPPPPPPVVSEFVWIRTASSKKRFYVKHPVTNEKHFVEREGSPEDAAMVGFFDDHLKHGIVPVDDPAQWSIRVDGRFTPEFRALLAEQAAFGPQTNPTPDDGGKGLRGVLESQTNGPCFLMRENEEEEEVWSDEEEEEDDEEEGEEGEEEEEEEEKGEGGIEEEARADEGEEAAQPEPKSVIAPTEVGQRVTARWIDGDQDYYPGVLTAIDTASGTFSVFFDEGVDQEGLTAENCHLCEEEV